MNVNVEEFMETFCDIYNQSDFTWKIDCKILLNVFLDIMIADCRHNQQLISNRIATLGSDERKTQRKYYQNAEAFLCHCKMRIKGRFAKYSLVGKVEDTLSLFNTMVTNASMVTSNTVTDSGIGNSIEQERTGNSGGGEEKSEPIATRTKNKRKRSA